jgi:hypothetical protein
MSVQIANVNPSVQTFQNWLDKTNQALFVISTQALTADLTVDGSSTTGNSVLEGSFSANVIAVANNLRGGSITTPGNLTITTNTSIINSGLFFVSNTRVTFVNNNTNITSVQTRIAGGSLDLISNTSIQGNTLFISSSNTNITADVINFVVEANTVDIDGNLVTVTSNTVFAGSNNIFQGNTSFEDGVFFDGTLEVDGSTSLRGDVVLGNTAANTISVVGAVNTSIVPDATNRRSLGAQDKIWENIWVGTINAVRVEYSGDLAGVNAISTNTLSVGAHANYISQSNDNIGSANVAGVFTPVPIFELNTLDGQTIKLLVQCRNENINTYSSSEMLLVHDGITPYMTVYATLNTNTAAPQYEYTTDISSGIVRVLVQQPNGSGNTAVKVMAHYLEG